VGHCLGIVDELAVTLDERLVDVRLDRLKVGKGGVAAGSELRTHGGDLHLRRHRRADGQLVMGQALIPELAVESDQRVADDVREHDVATGILDLLDHRTPFGMPEFEILVGHPFGAVLLDEYLADLGHFFWIYVVRPDDEEFFPAQRVHDPGNIIGKLLVRHGVGVDDVFGALIAFVKGRVEIQVAPPLYDGQHGFPACRRVGAEHRGHPVLNDELGYLLVVSFRVGSPVFHDGLEPPSTDAAAGVDLADRHQGRVRERLFDDRQPACLRKQNAYADIAACCERTPRLAPDMRKSACGTSRRSRRIPQKVSPAHYSVPLIFEKRERKNPTRPIKVYREAVLP
jgi:hypothetical protein